MFTRYAVLYQDHTNVTSVNTYGLVQLSKLFPARSKGLNYSILLLNTFRYFWTTKHSKNSKLIFKTNT